MPLSLLAATDGSASADQAVCLAASLAKGGSLTLLAVTPAEAPATLSLLDEIATTLGGSPGSLAAEDHRRAELASVAALDEARHIAESALKRGECRLLAPVDGRPAEVILHELATHDYELVVVGSHGRGALGRLLVGSVTGELLGHAGKPVLVARGDHVDALVVGLDGTAASERAAAFAGRLALDRQLPVHLVVAHQVDAWALPVADARIEAIIREAAFRWAARVRALPGLTSATVEVVHGEPSRVLMHRAERLGASLVVIGRGRDRLGSVARRLARDAHASILVVP